MLLNLRLATVPGFFRFECDLLADIAQHPVIGYYLFAVQFIFAVIGAKHKICTDADNGYEYHPEYVTKCFGGRRCIVDNMHAGNKNDDAINDFAYE